MDVFGPRGRHDLNRLFKAALVHGVWLYTYLVVICIQIIRNDFKISAVRVRFKAPIQKSSIIVDCP
jgi:hypothetical protein